MLVVADRRVDGDGKLRFQLKREDVPLTSRLRMNFMANTDKDSDMGYGGGITITY